MIIRKAEDQFGFLSFFVVQKSGHGFHCLTIFSGGTRYNRLQSAVRMAGGGAVVIDGNVISGCVSGGQSAGESGGAGALKSVFKASWEEKPDVGGSIFRSGSSMWNAGGAGVSWRGACDCSSDLSCWCLCCYAAHRVWSLSARHLWSYFRWFLAGDCGGCRIF